MASTRSTTDPQPLSERYTHWVLRHRWAVLLTALLLTAAAAAGVPKLDLATDYRVFFSPDNPDLAAYEAVENIYTKNDNVLFVLQPASGDVFTPELLDTMRSLTTDAWQIPYSTRVDGLTNFQHTWADGDELIVEDLVGPGPITPDVVARARQVGLSEPILVGRLVSPDAPHRGNQCPRFSTWTVEGRAAGHGRTCPRTPAHLPRRSPRPRDTRLGHRDDELVFRGSAHARHAVRHAADVRRPHTGDRPVPSVDVGHRQHPHRSPPLDPDRGRRRGTHGSTPRSGVGGRARSSS